MTRNGYGVRGVWLAGVVISAFTTGAARAQLELEWVERIKKSEGGTISDLAVDNAGNVYIAGSFFGGIDFDGDGEDEFTTGSTEEASMDAFVAKYSRTGELRWVRRVAGEWEQYGIALSVDANENVLLYGDYYQDADFNEDGVPDIVGEYSGPDFAGSYDVFLAKYDAGSALLWVQNFVGLGDDSAGDVAVDASDNCYVCGELYDELSIGDLHLEVPSDAYYVAKCDPNGNFLWARTAEAVHTDGEFGSSEAYSFGSELAVDAAGHSYAAVTLGYFEPFTPGEESDFAGFDLDGDGVADVADEGSYLLKYDPSGAFIRAVEADGYTVTDLAAHSNGELYVDSFSGLRKYSPAGNLQWFQARSYLLLAVGPDGDAYLLDGPNPPRNEVSLFVYNKRGRLGWTMSVEAGRKAEGSFSSLAVDRTGDVYVAGHLGDENATVPGDVSTLFVAKLVPEGNDRGKREDVLAGGIFVETPTAYALEQNVPNPFNTATSIGFSLKEAVHVCLTVYDVMGREVHRLADQVMGPGHHEASFDARGLASGLYVYRIEAGEFVETGRMMLVK